MIDSVDATKTGVLLGSLDGLGVKHLDYIIANHAEQDHSGAIPALLAKYPEAKVVATARCQEMLGYLLLVPGDRVISVNDGETISLGKKTLEFIHFPRVHWPETMLTYLREDKILFPCDLFSSHWATSDLYVKDENQAYTAAKRFYAEIMMPFRPNIQRNWVKLTEYAIDLIAPSHGPIYPKPKFILNAYHEWAFDEPKHLAVIAYVSMHGSTRKMVEHLTSALTLKGVKVEQFDLTVTDIGKLAVALVDAATIVIGTATALGGAHPAAVYAAFLANALRPKAKFATIIGSQGWGGQAIEQLSGLLPNLKAEIISPLMIQGLPEAEDFKALDDLANTIAGKHKELKLV